MVVEVTGMEEESQMAEPAIAALNPDSDRAEVDENESEAVYPVSPHPISEAQFTMEESADSHTAELRSLQSRLKDLESRVGLVDTMYNIHEATKVAMSQDADGPNYFEMELWGHDPYQRRSLEMGFFKDIMFFLQRIRGSYDALKIYDDRRKAAHAEALSRKKTRYESETERRISTQAFFRGDRAKLVLVNWDLFVMEKHRESTLTPIEVISSEPDSRTILQLVSQESGSDEINFSQSEWVPSSKKEGGFEGQQLLPERIKIRSLPLLDVLSKVMKKDVLLKLWTPVAVMLRPYRELVYYEEQLREYLAGLEKTFQNLDDTAHESKRFASRSDNPEVGQESVSIHSHEKSPTEAQEMPGGEEGNVTEDGAAEVLAGRGGQVADANRDGNEPESVGSDKPTQDTNHKDTQSGGDGANNGKEGSEEGQTELSNSITALIHLRCLTEFIEQEIKPKREYISSMECTHIHFHDLWYLFKPGDQVLEQGEKQAYVVLRVHGPVHKVEEPWGRWDQRDSDTDSDTESDTETADEVFTLHCLYIDFDGKVFGPVPKRFSISPFGELKAVKSLPVYPLRFAKGSQARQKLIDRGKMLLEVAEHKAMYYTGPTIDKRDEIDSQVVIDFSEALADEGRREAWEPTIGSTNTASDEREEQTCRALCCIRQHIRQGFHVDTMMTTDYIRTLVPDNSLRAPSLVLSPRSLEDIVNSAEELTDTELLLMTYRVFGFVLRSRKWAQLDMTFLRHENSNARHLNIDAFRRLELPTGHREMVQSLVTQHFRSKQAITTRDEQTDLIQGKGKGLIMLLHGAPGVGKTTTAEGISELFKKPLFTITCGDLGTTAKEVETELEKSFSLASRWGCILLLDEADVFLSARERNDFNRNGLVAVFLRVLEYYTGILFLTTNRIGDLDEAFASRIHMSLHYPELDEPATLKVFELHLDLIKQRFRKQGRPVTLDESSIRNFAIRHFREQPYNRWNGRQIRNACQTALALAEFDAQDGALEINLEVDTSIPVALDLKYFLTVQKAYIDFSKYLANIQGTQGDRRAYDLGLRARTDTPFAAKQNRFDSVSAETQRRQPQHHEARYSTSHLFGPQTESFQGGSGYQQNYRPASQAHNLSHSVPHLHLHEASIGFRGYENVPTYGTPGPSHQAQMESRSSPGRQQDVPYEILQGNIPAAYSGDGHTRPVVSSEGSPLPYRVAQHSTPHYGYSGGSLGGHQAGIQVSGFAGASPRVQEGPADPTTAGYPTAPGGPMRISQQGNSMSQT